MITEKGPKTRGLSAPERRERNREEMRDGIVAVAREIMREQGIDALNLNEIARRVGITPPALYTYFSGKMALYDELYRIAMRLFREAEDDLRASTSPDWDRIHQWFGRRVALAEAHPDLYHLAFGLPVAGFVPSQESLDEVRKLYDAAVGNVIEVIDAGVMRPQVPREQAADLLLSMRLGIVASHVGRYRQLPTEDRVARLVPELMAVLRAAWEAGDQGSFNGSGPGVSVVKEHA